MTEESGFEGKAVFIDRDGTLNVEKHYLFRPDDFEFIPGAVEAVRRLNVAGFKVVVLSNQSGVARGLYTEDDVRKLHMFVTERLKKERAYIDAFFYCPHHPEGTVSRYARECNCRKPRPGMVLRAEEALGIRLQSSYVVGDSLADIQLALAVPLRPLLVRTGHGLDTEKQMGYGEQECLTFDDLGAAVDHILKQGAG